MKHSQEVGFSLLGHFLGMFHVQEVRIKLLEFLQWESLSVYDFSNVRDGLFLE